VSRRSRSRHGDGRRVRLDLHMHTLRSDGHASPSAVLAAAAAGQLDVIAITDHDLAPEIPAGIHEVNGRSVRVLAGVEISTMHEDEELHLLVYFPGEMPPSFAQWCTGRAQWRARWFDAAMEIVGLDARADEDALAGRRSLTRVHMARAVVDAGMVPDMTTAFRAWIGHAAGHVPHIDLSFSEAISIARDAGGWTSWAHPGLAMAQAWAPAFASQGLHALEAWRPRGGKHRRDSLHRLANRHGLAITGGSDHHGGGGRPLGSFAVPLRVLGATAEALELNVTQLAQA